MWRAIFLTVLVVVGCAVPITESRSHGAPVLATYTFGLTLMTGMNNELFTLFIVKEYEGSVIATEPITRGQFVLQAQGAVPSKANPNNENLFGKHHVENCLPPPELAGQGVVVTDCGVFDQLWKLRFWEYPFRLSSGQHPGQGWAEEPSRPSDRQMVMLGDYGMLHMHSMVKDEDLFRLLRDIGDSAWVENYRSVVK